MAPSILLLPSELKHHIAELSSPKSLAALARTHSAYQKVAEKVLYHTIHILTLYDDSLECMETLATNSEKAALVHFLTIESARNNLDKNRRVMTYLSKGLINMHSLTDFRVRIRPHEVEAQMVKVLDNIFCEGHFRLQTLYCHDVLDISRIIKSQTELRILGLYNGNHEILLNTFRELHDTVFLPIIFSLDRETFLPVFNHISIFPVVYPIDRRATVHRAIAQSIDQDRGSFMLAKTNRVSELSIYLTDSSDLPSIYALAKDMAMTFPEIEWLNFWFECWPEIPLQEKEEALSCFSKLLGVNFY